MGNTWEIEMFDYDGGRGWVSVASFEGSPRTAMRQLVAVQKQNNAGAYRLVWRP